MVNQINELSVSEMLRITGGNTADFMEKVAQHIESLESEVVKLRTRVQELEKGNTNE